MASGPGSATRELCDLGHHSLSLILGFLLCKNEKVR